MSYLKAIMMTLYMVKLAKRISQDRYPNSIIDYKSFVDKGPGILKKIKNLNKTNKQGKSNQFW